MIADVSLIALVVAAGSGLVSGVVLLRARRATVSGAALMGTSLLTLAAALLEVRGHLAISRPMLVAAAGIGGPLTLSAYPRLRWRHPVDFVALCVLGGSGVLATLMWRDAGALGAFGILSFVTLFAHTWWRIEDSSDRERRALIWMALSVGVTGMLVAVGSFATASGDFGGVLLLLLAVVGPSLYVGVVLPDIVDVRGLVVRSVVFGAAVTVVLALFAMVVALIDLLGAEEPSAGSLGLVAAACAIAFHPTQVLLRGTIDELLFGKRPDPLGAASRVAGSIGDDPIAALSAVRDALVLPYAALRLSTGELVTSGTAVTHTRSIPLEGTEAELVIGLRPGDLSLSASDREVLGLVAPLLAQTLRAQALAADLQDSREATISAVEEERRRLRRDLHDGLGPQLSGIAFTSDAVRNLVHTDPDAADALLVQLRADTTSAIADIRRLVYAMRPPALDELGLVPALRQQGLGLRSPDGRAMRVELVAPDTLPQLSAAVEVAAYRVVVEALANAARHSGAARATVTLRVDGKTLLLDVADHGGAASSPWTPGVGLSSMRERATELGGTLTAGPTHEGGRVTAVLPLA